MNLDKNDAMNADSYIYRQIRIELALAEERAKHERLLEVKEEPDEDQSSTHHHINSFYNEMKEPKSEEAMAVARNKIRAIRKALIMRRQTTKLSLNIAAATEAAKKGAKAAEDSVSPGQMKVSSALFGFDTSQNDSPYITDTATEAEGPAPPKKQLTRKTSNSSPSVRLQDQQNPQPEKAKSKSQFFKQKDGVVSKEESPARVEESTKLNANNAR